MDANLFLSHTSEVVRNQNVNKRSKEKKKIVLSLTNLLKRIIKTQEKNQYDKAYGFFEEQEPH